MRADAHACVFTHTGDQRTAVRVSPPRALSTLFLRQALLTLPSRPNWLAGKHPEIHLSTSPALRLQASTHMPIFFLKKKNNVWGGVYVCVF